MGSWRICGTRLVKLWHEFIEKHVNEPHFFIE